jgi:hypothetical protein
MKAFDIAVSKFGQLFLTRRNGEERHTGRGNIKVKVKHRMYSLYGKESVFPTFCKSFSVCLL